MKVDWKNQMAKSPVCGMTVNYSLLPCLRLCTFATIIRAGIMKTGKMTAKLKLKNDSPIEIT